MWGRPWGLKTDDPCRLLCNAPDWSDAIANDMGTVGHASKFQEFRWFNLGVPQSYQTVDWFNNMV